MGDDNGACVQSGVNDRVPAFNNRGSGHKLTILVTKKVAISWFIFGSLAFRTIAYSVI